MFYGLIIAQSKRKLTVLTAEGGEEVKHSCPAHTPNVVGCILIRPPDNGLPEFIATTFRETPRCGVPSGAPQNRPQNMPADAVPPERRGTFRILSSKHIGAVVDAVSNDFVGVPMTVLNHVLPQDGARVVFRTLPGTKLCTSMMVQVPTDTPLRAHVCSVRGCNKRACNGVHVPTSVAVTENNECVVCPKVLHMSECMTPTCPCYHPPRYVQTLWGFDSGNRSTYTAGNSSVVPASVDEEENSDENENGGVIEALSYLDGRTGIVQHWSATKREVFIAVGGREVVLADPKGTFRFHRDESAMLHHLNGHLEATPLFINNGITSKYHEIVMLPEPDHAIGTVSSAEAATPTPHRATSAGDGVGPSDAIWTRIRTGCVATFRDRGSPTSCVPSVLLRKHTYIVAIGGEVSLHPDDRLQLSLRDTTGKCVVDRMAVVTRSPDATTITFELKRCQCRKKDTCPRRCLVVEIVDPCGVVCSSCPLFVQGHGTQMTSIEESECVMADTASATYRFWTHNFVPPSSTIHDCLFFDPGRSNPLLERVQDYDPGHSTAEREVIVCDPSDRDLSMFVNSVTPLVGQLDIAGQCAALSWAVAGRLGGIPCGPEFDDDVEDYITEIRGTSAAVQMGLLRSGLCRHRAVLYKLLCDNFGIQCALVRGHFNGGRHAWNIVRVGPNDDDMFVVDAMLDPGGMLPLVHTMQYSFFGTPLRSNPTVMGQLAATSGTFFSALGSFGAKRSWGEVTISSPIGRGTTGIVHKGEVGGFTVAVKEYQHNGSFDAAMFEYQWLRRFESCPQIVKCVGLCKTNTSTKLYLQYRSHSLLTLMNTLEGAMALEKIVEVAYNVAVALACVHEAGVVHRDIKAENVVLDAAPEDMDNLEYAEHCTAFTITSVQLCDFAEAIAASDVVQGSELVGSDPYMAPEVRHKHKYGTAADIWSLGILLTEMVNVHLTTLTSAVTRVVHIDDPSGKRRKVGVPILHCGSDVPKWFRDLVERCTHPDPEQRPTAADIVSLLNKKRKVTK